MNRSRPRLAPLALLALALVAAPAPAQEGEAAAAAKAQDAAKAWLALTDAGKYAESWDRASARFQAAITKPDWEKALSSARSPLGALKSRKLKSATFTRQLPGVPDGEYVVIQFDTQFEKKLSAVETVTPAKEQDGAWRVSGYYIR